MGLLSSAGRSVVKLTAICILGHAGDDRRVIIRAGLNADRVVAVASVLHGGTVLDLKGVRFCAANQARLIVRSCNYQLGQGWLTFSASEALAAVEQLAVQLGIALVLPTDERAGTAAKLEYFRLG